MGHFGPPILKKIWSPENVHEVLVNCLFKLAQEKVWLGELTVPQWPKLLTWDVKQQNKQTVFGVSIKAWLKPFSSASETSLNIEISLEARLYVILSSKRITKALIICTDAQAGLRLFCLQTPRRPVLSRQGPYIKQAIKYSLSAP